jgi:hypothetical protein
MGDMMMKETLDDINERHCKEIKEYCNNCKHENVHVYKANECLNSGWGRIDNFSNEHFTIGKGKHYDSIMIKCADCGAPLVSYECGEINLFVKASYYSDEAKL